MKTIRTACPRDCYDSCALMAGVDEAGRVISVKGDGDDPVTRGLTCPRCAKDAEHVYTNRVLHPHVRTGDKPARRFKRSGWDEALDLLAGRLQNALEKHGPGCVLYLDYAGNMGLLANAFPQRLWNLLGAVRTDHAICSRSGHVALALHYGQVYGVQPEELPEKKLIVYWGFNPADSAPHQWALSLRAKREKGAQIVVIDPRKSRSALKADLWVRPKPGTDVVLAYGISRYLIERDLMDGDFISAYTSGFDKFKREALRWIPKEVQNITGVPRDLIAQLGEAYAQKKPSATLIGIGMQKSIQGAESVRAASLVPALTGQHRGFYYSNAMGRFIDSNSIEWVERGGGAADTVSQVDLGNHVKDGRFKFIYIACMNPALTLPNQQAFREGLLRDDVFTAVHDPHWTETCDYADSVLPAQSFLEKEDVIVPWSHGYVRKSERVMDPLAESRHEIRVMQDLAQRLGLEARGLYEDPWAVLEKAFEGAVQEPGTFQGILKGHRTKLKYRPRDQYQTPSGKMEFYSQAAEARGHSPLPLFIPNHLDEGRFLLIGSAVPEYTHTQFQDVYGPIPASVTIHPNDALASGIQEGEAVVLLNDLGQTTVRATISDAVPQGALWCPRQFTGTDGNPHNILTSGRTQPIGNGSILNSTEVRIRKA